MIEFFFDCSSPWTYLAFRNIQILASDMKVAIAWKPVLVGGIFNSVNKAMYTSREDTSTPKNRYAMKDLQDCARATGVSIIFPPKVFPVNSVKVMRGCLWIAQDAAAQAHYTTFVEATFAAYFTRQEDISQDEVLAAICRQTGIDADAFLAGISRADIKEALKANTDEVIRRGGFGSPTFFVGDDMYFGNDRLPLVKAALEASAKPPAATQN